MTAQSRRPDPRGRGTAATIEGVFAALWFFWAGPASAGLAASLRAGAVLALVTAGAGAGLAFRHRLQPTALQDPAARWRYRRVAVVEFGVLAAGAVILGTAGQGRWVPVLAGAVVGAHFLPLGRVFGNRLMRPLGLVLIAVAAVAAAVGLATAVVPALLVGTVTGTALLLTAMLTLAGEGHPRPLPAPGTPPLRRATRTTRVGSSS